MDELNKMPADNFNKVTLNLMIDNRTDILINKELLVRILSHLENKSPDDIYESLEGIRAKTRQNIVTALVRVMSN